MNVEAVAQLIVTAVTTLWGFRSVAAKLNNYVPVEIYRAKVTDLHDQINSLKIELAVMKERLK